MRQAQIESALRAAGVPLTIRQIAGRLGCSVVVVRRAIYAMDLAMCPAPKTGTRGRPALAYSLKE